MPVCDPFLQNFRQYLIQDFYQNFDVFSGETFFVGIGRSNPWITAAGVNSDNVPPKNVDSTSSSIDFWQKAFAFKKIQKDMVSIVVRRYDWEPNVVYSPYRDDVDLYDDEDPSAFYVLVDEVRVYKCIDNNYGSASTEAPTHTDAQIRTLSDGYRWKFLYSVPESKRKFLTKTQGSSRGYMPVEYVTQIYENDDRLLQYEVQKAAITGSIDFIDIDQGLRNFTVSDRVLFYDEANQVVGGTAAGSTSVSIGGSKLVYQNDYYNNMTIKFESGNGSGQQRRIVDYTVNADSTATVVLSTPLNYGVSGGASATIYSILPTVTVIGDGQGLSDILNTSATAAEITVTFLSTTAGSTSDSCVCESTTRRFLDRFELINTGKNYSYADLKVVAGLTFTESLNYGLNDLADAVISPFGGHGSNPVKELGASSLMIVTNFETDENSKITTENDYRQFCLIQSPLLNKKQIRFNMYDAGLTNSFTVGATAYQGMTGAGGYTGYDLAFGKILAWKPGRLGTTGTSELTIGNITGGNFQVGGFINGITTQEITELFEKTIAGTENRFLRRLRMVPYASLLFDASGTDFTPNKYAISIGNTADRMVSSFSRGKIYKWTPKIGTNLVGDLYLEYPRGDFQINENITQVYPEYLYPGTTGPIAKIIEIRDFEEAEETVYDQTVRLALNYDGLKQFDTDSFVKDALVSNSYASGYVMDWVPATGATTGNIRILPIKGNFETNQNLIYTDSGTTGATITSVLSEPELKYNTGTILHLQNIRPVERSPEQKEEIKLVIEF